MDYEGCVDQNQCFGYPEGCIKNKTCLMMTSLKMSGDKVDVELIKSTSDKSDYVAMAFSDDDKMGKDLVFACNYYWTGNVDVNMFWNEGRSQPLKLENERNDTIRSATSKYVVGGGGSFLICKFTLEKDVTVKGNRFDFEKGHHILLATGKAKDDKLNKHDYKVASKSKFGKLENQTGRYIYYEYIDKYNPLLIE